MTMSATVCTQQLTPHAELLWCLKVHTARPSDPTNNFTVLVHMLWKCYRTLLLYHYQLCYDIIVATLHSSPRIIFACFSMAASSSVLCSVEHLSDDDGPNFSSNSVPDFRTKEAPQQKKNPGRKKTKVNFVKTSLDTRSIRYRVDGRCGCTCRCFGPYRNPTVFAKVLQERRTVQQMSKLEQDKYVGSSK